MTPTPEDIARALATLPQTRAIITAAYEEDRAGLRVLSAQPCAADTPLICVAAQKGHRIDPLIRDSRAFALCLLREGDRLLERKFPIPHASGDAGDPFDAIPIVTITTDSPVPARCPVALDCEVVRHFDLEADHELFIGQVVGVRIVEAGDVSTDDGAAHI